MFYVERFFVCFEVQFRHGLRCLHAVDLVIGAEEWTFEVFEFIANAVFSSSVVVRRSSRDYY